MKRARLIQIYNTKHSGVQINETFEDIELIQLENCNKVVNKRGKKEAKL